MILFYVEFQYVHTMEQSNLKRTKCKCEGIGTERISGLHAAKLQDYVKYDACSEEGTKN